MSEVLSSKKNSSRDKGEYNAVISLAAYFTAKNNQSYAKHINVTSKLHKCIQKIAKSRHFVFYNLLHVHT